MAAPSSRFILAMKLGLTSLGHTDSQESVTVQWPKASWSICRTMLRPRRVLPKEDYSPTVLSAVSRMSTAE